MKEIGGATKTLFTVIGLALTAFTAWIAWETFAGDRRQEPSAIIGLADYELRAQDTEVYYFLPRECEASVLGVVPFQIKNNSSQSMDNIRFVITLNNSSNMGFLADERVNELFDNTAPYIAEISRSYGRSSTTEYVQYDINTLPAGALITLTEVMMIPERLQIEIENVDGQADLFQIDYSFEFQAQLLHSGLAPIVRTLALSGLRAPSSQEFEALLMQVLERRDTQSTVRVSRLWGLFPRERPGANIITLLPNPSVCTNEYPLLEPIEARSFAYFE